MSKRGESVLIKAFVSGILITLLCVASIRYVFAETPDDSKGIVLGASVARSDKESTTSLPVETYFGDPKFSSITDQLAAQGITVYPEDAISYFPEATLGIGSVIRVVRATPVTIQDGKRKTTYRTWNKTVKAIFDEKGIALGNDDKVSVSFDAALEPNSTITITRVSITQVAEKESIDFQTQKKDDPTLDRGKAKTTQAGKKGERTKVYEVRREDGEEIARKLLENKITKDPITEIIMVGTKPVITVDCRFNDWVIDASAKNNIDPNQLCYRMMKESRGNPNSDGGQYKGLFQYEAGFWAGVSTKAGFSGASIWDAKAQVYVTAWAWAHGYRGRWPNP